VIFLERTIKAIVNQMNTGTVSQAMLGKLLRVRVVHVWALPSAEITSLAELK